MAKNNQPQVSGKAKTSPNEEISKSFRIIGENFIKISELLASSTFASETNGKSKKRVRDENKPKKPLSSYIYFSVAQRNRIIKEHPKASNTEVATLLGQEWKKLTDKQKQPYINLAAKDKERYETELKDYNPTEIKPEVISTPTEEPKSKKPKVEPTTEPKKPVKKEKVTKPTKETKESKKSKATEQTKSDPKKSKKADQSKNKKPKK